MKSRRTVSLSRGSSWQIFCASMCGDVRRLPVQSRGFVPAEELNGRAWRVPLPSVFQHGRRAGRHKAHAGLIRIPD